MPLLRRRRPPDVVRAVQLPPGDRRLAWAVTVDGLPVVAASGGLVLPAGVVGADEGEAPSVLAWGEVERALWRPPVLTVLQIAPVEGTGPSARLELVDPGDLPEVVRARVTTSVAWSGHVRLAPAGGVRVVGRRVPGQDALHWQLVYDKGTDPHDPAVREQAEQAALEARRTIG
jgi:hypothetical protein